MSDIAVPKSVVMPKTMYEDEWHKCNDFFFYFAVAVQVSFLNAPIAPILMAVGGYFMVIGTTPLQFKILAIFVPIFCLISMIHTYNTAQGYNILRQTDDDDAK